MKECTVCKISKDLEEFYKTPKNKNQYLSICKVCHRSKSKEYRERNSDVIKIKKKIYREANKDKISEKEKERRENSDKKKSAEYQRKYQEENKDKIKENKRLYYQKNKQEFLERSKLRNELKNEEVREYHKSYRSIRNSRRNKRRKEDPDYRLKYRLRSIIYESFRRNGYTKSSKTFEIIGCSFEEFKSYIESKFENWMSWENRGLYNGEFNYGWDIDHIIPLSSAESVEDIIKLNHYTNLQPLCSKINRDIKRDLSTLDIYR